MAFKDELNKCIELFGCTGRELAETSGLSAAVISRYRAGTRIPSPDSEQISKLAAGLAALSEKSGGEELSKDAIYAALTSSLRPQIFDFDRFTENFNNLISALDLNMNELARFMSYDASYISRVRAGQRRPSDPHGFSDGICRFVVSHRIRKSDKVAIATLIGRTADELQDERVCLAELQDWICSGDAGKADQMGGFLSKLDDFDLGEYIRSIHFDELKVPTVPFQLPTSKNYYGLVQMREGELDFFKATLLSRSTEPVFMCSDMEMSDMAEDLEFGKKWMFAIAMTLKKGLHLNMIHNLERPFDELMLGLESWIPIYMTGQITPYYLKDVRNGVYCHLNYVSGAAALEGECISGHHKNGRYYLTKNKDEITYYQEKARLLLSKALPLMEIYHQNSEKSYRAFLVSDAETDGTRHRILSSPPLYTMPVNLLRNILERNALSETDAAKIMEYAAWQRANVESVLAKNTMLDEIPQISQEEFNNSPVSLPLEGAFYEKDVSYTYEEYLEHLRQTRLFHDNHPNYTAELNITRAFRHIQIIIHEGKWAMISKSKSPAVHFVIRHQKLREALENLIIPVAE